MALIVERVVRRGYSVIYFGKYFFISLYVYVYLIRWKEYGVLEN